MRRLAALLAVSVGAASLLAAPSAKPDVSSIEQFRRAVEADWLLQDRVRTAARVKKGRPATTQGDAAGAVDGVKNGKWGFHTLEDKRPWWHVDLGKAQPLDRVVVFNRCDRGSAGRNAHIELALSADGKQWQVAYQHKGKPAFGGVGYGKPLVVKLDGKTARFVRLQHPTKAWFHLDEVEVFAAADPKKNIALGRPRRGATRPVSLS